MKRKITTLLGALIMLLFIGELSAQVPQAFNYQAVARSSSGNLIASHAVGIKIIIHQSSAGGTIVYSETFAPTTNQFGLFTISIGQGTPVSGTFSSITWSSGNYWLQVQMDATGGTTYSWNNGAGMGYIEFLTYALVPSQAGIQNQTYNFAVSVSFEWFS